MEMGIDIIMARMILGIPHICQVGVAKIRANSASYGSQCHTKS